MHVDVKHTKKHPLGDSKEAGEVQCSMKYFQAPLLTCAGTDSPTLMRHLQHDSIADAHRPMGNCHAVASGRQHNAATGNVPAVSMSCSHAHVIFCAAQCTMLCSAHEQQMQSDLKFKLYILVVLLRENQWLDLSAHHAAISFAVNAPDALAALR